jgi:hypothetical protein
MKDLSCPHCGTLLRLDDSQTQAWCRCPGCGVAFRPDAPRPAEDAILDVLPADDAEEASATYGLQTESTPQAVRQPRRKPSPWLEWEAKLREFHRTLRPESNRGLWFACVLAGVAILGGSFDLHLTIKLALALVLGAVSGLIAYPDFRYCLIGLPCFVLAAVVSAALVHYYVAATPYHSGEIVLAGMLTWLPFFGLYYLLLRLAVVGFAPPDDPEDGPVVTPRRTTVAEEPTELAPPGSRWKIIIGGILGGLFFFGLGFGAWYGMADKGTPQTILFGLLGMVFMGFGVLLVVGLGVVLVRRSPIPEVAIRGVMPMPRPARRPLWRNLGPVFRGVVVGLAALWGVALLIALFLPFGKLHALCLGFGLVVSIFGYGWFAIACRMHGVPWNIIFSVRRWTSVPWADDLARDDPEGVGRPLVLCGLGVLSFLATFVLLLIKEKWPSAAGPVPPGIAGNPAPGPPQPPAPAVLPAVEKLFTRGPREYLSDLKEFGVTNGPWPFTKNGTVGDGKTPIAANGIASPHGLGMHPPDKPTFAAAQYRLGKQAAVFKAAVAIDDTARAPFSPAVFEVYGDGRRLWQSPPVPGPRRPPQECQVDVTGVDVLELRVVSQGSHFDLHAVWLEPRLLQKNDTPDP